MLRPAVPVLLAVPSRLRVFAGLLFYVLASPAWADDDLPIIESIDDLVPCTLTAPSGLSRVEASCGWLEVPENPEQPEQGNIRLHLALAPAIDSSAEGAPLAVLAGGPGQAAYDLYASRAGGFSRIRQRHPILILDQRGTGRSNRLQCELQEDAEEEEYSAELMKQVVSECLATLPADPRFYTTSVAVRDLDHAREVLGFDQLNLWGGSYGTRVALHYLRRYPAQTRAVIIDGVVPPDMVLGPQIAIEAQHALDAILDRCASDASCSEAFPDLRSDLARLRAQLDAAPIAVSVTDPVSGELLETEFGNFHLSIALRLLSYAPQTVALMPLLIHEAADGNVAPLAGQALMLGSDIGEALALGMHNAIVCTEDMPYFEPHMVDRDALENSYLGTLQIDSLVAICENWPAGFIDDDFRDAVSSDVPVLILSGQFDPVTPSSYGEHVRAGLSNAEHFVIEGQGHGQLGVSCVPRLLGQFVDEASTKTLNQSCLEDVSADGFFIDFNGPTP